MVQADDKKGSAHKGINKFEKMNGTTMDEDILDELPSLPKASNKSSMQSHNDAGLDRSRSIEPESISSKSVNEFVQSQKNIDQVRSVNDYKADTNRPDARYDDYLSAGYSNSSENLGPRRQNSDSASNYAQQTVNKNARIQSQNDSVFMPTEENSSKQLEELALPTFNNEVKSNPVSASSAAVQNNTVPAKIIAPLKNDTLYFAVLRAKIEDERRQEEIIRELEGTTSGTLITSLKEHLKKDQYETDIVEMDAKIKNLIQPLQVLEQEWRVLNKEESIIRKKLDSIEDNIRINTEELKRLMLKKVELKKNLAECSIDSQTKTVVEENSVIHN